MTKHSSKYQYDFERFFHQRMGYKILADPYQYAYVEALLESPEESQAIFVDAPAGSGKTSLSIAAAYYLLKEQKIDQIIYVRNTVSLRENGFLPGTPEEKEEVFMRPLVESINRVGIADGKQDLYDDLIMTEQLLPVSTSYLRGIDISGDAMIIIDEAQNLSLGELRTVLTRTHDSVKVVVIGSHLQVDTPDIQKFGEKGILPFELFMSHFNENEQIPTKRIQLKNNYRGKFAQYADMVHNTVSRFNKEEERAIKKKEYELLLQKEKIADRIIEVDETEDDILYETVFDKKEEWAEEFVEEPLEVHPATAYLVE